MDKISQYEHLLTLLQAERFVSGSSLARALGISRTVVNRRIQELGEMGLRIHAVTGKGYHLADPFALLADPPPGFPADLCWFRHLITTSTNEDALALTRLHQAPVMVATEYQTQGRGRRGRGWHSAFGQDLACSVGFPLAGPESLRPFSLVTGALLAELVSDLFDIPVGVKWPNDLLVEGAKLAGILTEIHTADGRTWVILGIGMNVNSADLGTVDQPAVSLRQLTNQRQDRSLLVAAIASTLARALRDEFGFDWLSSWKRFDLLVGRPLKVLRGEDVLEGVGAGVASDGALRVNTRDGEVQVTGGQVSVRSA